MAAVLTQQPSEWNMAYAPLVFVMSGLGSADKYIVYVEVNGQNIATLRQPENPAGVGIFDVSNIIQAYLEPEFVETTPRVAPSTTAACTYRIKYGIETAGVPEFTGYSATKYALNGYVNWRQLNWDVDPFRTGVTEFACESPGYDGLIDQKRFLTNYPGEYTIRRDEYHTLSFFNQFENFTLAQFQDQPYFVDIKHYNAAGAQITQYNYVISEDTGLGPRMNCNDQGPYEYNLANWIGHVGIGTKNMTEAGLPIPAQSVKYTVTLYSLNGCYYGLNGPISDCEDTGELVDFYGQVEYQATFNIQDDCTPFDPIRISFLNQYGMRDYYTFDRRNTYTVDTNRSNYKQVLGTWSSDTFSIDQVGRGLRTFSSEIEELMMLSTNWMDDETSKWLQELFTSPHILIYKDGQWEPCVINSKTYDERTKARQKMYRYDISVRYSNPKTVQRG